MTPEARESLKNSQRSTKASAEKPVHECGHPPKRVYPSIPKTDNHHEKSIVRAVPTIPILILYTKNQLINTWITRATPETHAMIAVFSWHCKNLCNVNWNGKLKWNGINQTATKPDRSATASGCPMNFNMGVANTNMGTNKTEDRNRTTQERCK